MHKHPICKAKLRHLPSQFSWLDQRLVRERYIDRLSHPACALYLFLVTVADARGLSYYADTSLCQRLSMARAELDQARQNLIKFGLVAYRHPLYQVLSLDAVATRVSHGEQVMADDDEPVDIKAVFERIWEVLS